MYEELVKGLREATGWKNASAHYSLMSEAANAIEELNMKLHGDEAAIAGMKREIERMVVADKPRWIPVTERLPEKYTHNLVYGSEIGIDILYFGNRGLFLDYHSDEINGVTHWMPLPEPPKEG